MHTPGAKIVEVSHVDGMLEILKVPCFCMNPVADYLHLHPFVTKRLECIQESSLKFWLSDLSPSIKD